VCATTLGHFAPGLAERTERNNKELFGVQLEFFTQTLFDVHPEEFWVNRRGEWAGWKRNLKHGVELGVCLQFVSLGLSFCGGDWWWNDSSDRLAFNFNLQLKEQLFVYYFANNDFSDFEQ